VHVLPNVPAPLIVMVSAMLRDVLDPRLRNL